MENLQELGYLGLFIVTFLAATVIPFTSDAAFVGFLALGFNMFVTLAVATLGNWTGSITTYWVGRAGNIQRIEKWFKISLTKLESKQPTVEKYGSLLAWLVWLPIVGDLFALALGFYKIDFRKTATFMLFGKFLRFVALCIVFYFANERWNIVWAR